MKIRLFLLPLTFLLLGGGLVRADPLTIEINPKSACVAPGMCSLITVTVTNSSNAAVRVTDVRITELLDRINVWRRTMDLDQFGEFTALLGELGPGAKKTFHFSVCLAQGAASDSFLRYEVRITSTLANGQRVENAAIGEAQVPEPATMLLLGTGLAGVAIKTRKRLKNRKSG